MLFKKEHYDLLYQFEKEFYYLRLDRAEKELWQKGYVYENGEANDLFKAYRSGYLLGRVIERGG